MPLTAPNLDDRTFDQLVHEALGRIPATCPEWTDHNVGDPGRTLIELFAWMTELLLYRTNQVPDKMYIHFLNMLNMRQEPASTATVPVTFLTAEPVRVPLQIPAEVEVATARTEVTPAVVFSTSRALVVQPARVGGAWRERDGEVRDEIPAVLLESGEWVRLFGPTPAAGDAFRIRLEQDLSGHVIQLDMECHYALGGGARPTEPPRVWEVWTGGGRGWQPLPVPPEQDTTGGFNFHHGFVRLFLPRVDASSATVGPPGTWIRCRYVQLRVDSCYTESPQIRRLQVSSRGATVEARHAVAVHGEVLGVSDGRPGQRFNTRRAPVLRRDPERDVLVVEVPERGPGGDGPLRYRADPWIEVADFAESTADDPHYVFDPLDGSVRFAPRLSQPDGTTRLLGRVPPKGARIRLRRYEVGGGRVGNLPKGAISVLRTAIPGVQRVVNREPAVGGLDAESLGEALARAPAWVRSRGRAVIAEDYEHIALLDRQVGRARCVAPGLKGVGVDSGAPPPGQVHVYLWPSSDGEKRLLKVQDLSISEALVDRVGVRLSACCPAGVRVRTLAGGAFSLEVRAELWLDEGVGGVSADTLRGAATSALIAFLDPWTGGPTGKGWPALRPVRASDLHATLSRLEGCASVERLDLAPRREGRRGEPVAEIVLPEGVLPALVAFEVLVRTS